MLLQKASNSSTVASVCYHIHSNLTSGKNNLTTGRIAAAHGRFNGFARWRLCAPKPNTCFIGLTRFQIPNTISIVHWLSRFCTVHGRYSLYFTTGRPFPLKIAPSQGICTPSNTWFLWSIRATAQTTSRLVQPFLHSSPQSVAIVHNGYLYLYLYLYL